MRHTAVAAARADHDDPSDRLALHSPSFLALPRALVRGPSPLTAPPHRPPPTGTSRRRRSGCSATRTTWDAGLSSVLITSDKGHVLIDGALPESAPKIAENINALGFE